MKNRVPIPTSSEELLTLAEKIQEQHLADGQISVLSPFDWNKTAALIKDAAEFHAKTQQLKRETKEFYQKRNARFNELKDFVRSSRDILTGFHLREMKIIGKWGFDVLDPKVTKAEPEQKSESKA